uniref:Uncharacterized protein n=1 Tax=Rhizophora mucronata TaxID=61149 RepID=A0A2P2Q1L3_RHIMU
MMVHHMILPKSQNIQLSNVTTTWIKNADT